MYGHPSVVVKKHLVEQASHADAMAAELRAHRENAAKEP